MFLKFQKEVAAARDQCWVQNIALSEEMKIVTVGDGRKKDRDVHCNTNTMAMCSYKLFESRGIPCRHIILVLRGEKQMELPMDYFMKRWDKRCKSHSVYDEYGNILDEKIMESSEPEIRKKIAIVRNKFEDLIQKANTSEEGMDFLLSSIANLEAPLDQILPTSNHTRQNEQEAFIGCDIPNQVTIYPPTDIHSKGRSKRIKKSKEVGGSKKKNRKEHHDCAGYANKWFYMMLAIVQPKKL